MSPPLTITQEESAKESSYISQNSKESSPAHDGHSVKAPSGRDHLDVPLNSPFDPSIESLSDISAHSLACPNDEESRAGYPLSHGEARLRSRSLGSERCWRHRLNDFWARNKGLILVTLAQLFGALMSVTTRLLETDGKHGPGMHPFQVIAAILPMAISPSLNLMSRSYSPA